MLQWTIYKNDQKIGQGKTWHKALDVLMVQDNIYVLNIRTGSGLVLVSTEVGNYKIVKEN